MPRRLLIAAAAAALLAGCGDSPAPEAGGDLTVVATTTQAADIARSVAGDRATVRGLIPPGADPHGFEVRPSDVEALAEADLVVRSGGDVDQWLAEAIDAAGGDAPVVTLVDHVETRPSGDHADEEHDEPPGGGAHVHAETADIDPHWWHDPRNGVLAAAAVRRALAEVDPGGAAAYERTGRGYERRLAELDDAIAACWSRVPAARRKLVTTHDSLGYYADRYGLEVLGAVIPSTSSQSQASAGAVDDLVQTIRREDVRAIFSETSLDARVEEAIAREAGARVGEPLHADALEAEGPASTYAGALATDTRALVEGLTGGEETCSLPG